jgi:hypothetical protein
MGRCREATYSAYAGGRYSAVAGGAACNENTGGEERKKKSARF